jgi:sugar O-acyltransferase (sialic acid O-acetyltransferase NeuD family)
MSQPIPIKIPLLNPNEPEARLVELHVAEGQPVKAGDVICTLETTKATNELTAEADGYVIGLRFSQGDTVRAGDVLAYLAADPNWTPPETEMPFPETGERTEIPAGLRITQPALSLAQEQGLDLCLLPKGPLVTVKMVHSVLGKQPEEPLHPAPTEFDPMAIIVYGGGGHGKSVIELLRALGTYRLIGIVDDGLSAGENILGLPVLGGHEALAKMRAEGVRLAVNAVGGIGNVGVRVKVFHQLAEAGFLFPAIVHPTAFIEPSAILSPGVQVFPLAYVGSDVRVGFGTIINTGAIVSHDCALGDYVNISPGAILAGGVQIEDRALIGMGVTINLYARIGEGARVGNSAVVKSNVPRGGVVRAGHIWPD